MVDGNSTLVVSHVPPANREMHTNWLPAPESAFSLFLRAYGASLLAVPGRAGPLLRRMTEWMVASSRRLEIVVGLAFGALFPGKGSP